MSQRNTPDSITMRANWNNIAIAFSLLFLVWIFYKLSTYPKTSIKQHSHDNHNHKHHTDSGKHEAIKTTSSHKHSVHVSEQDSTAQLNLKLQKAQAKIAELKKLLFKHKAISKKEQKRETTSDNKKFTGHKIVHLDLKGAPPRMPYLIKLLSYFKKWGATGVLVEYEDMFPYSGELKSLKTSHAYSKEEITNFLKECENQKLIVVPLIQTFGHFEFVLKHKKFASYRETALATNSICPNNKGSVPLVKKIIDQVLVLHPKIKYFHVGGDEVFNIKTCSKCLADQRNKTRLFIDHMTPILKHVKKKNMIPLMWDDMMRHWSIEEMKELGAFMEPMVWGYGAIKDEYYPEDMWQKFSAAFPKMWVASAFKGASKPDSDYVPIGFHLKNNLDWLDVISSLPDTTTIEGIALTGWSRYDHYAALCELLPAALPSLAFCLSALNNGDMDKSLEKGIDESLGFSDTFSLKITPYSRKYQMVTATFPGHEIFTMVNNLTQARYALNGVKHLETGWMLARQVENHFLSYQHIHHALNYSRHALDILNELKDPILEPLNEVYNEKVVSEWMTDKVLANIKYTKKRVKELSDLENALG